MALPERMRAVEVPAPGEPFDLVERPVPEPGPAEVCLAVEACGVCRGDVHVRESNPAVEYPRIPGHEIVGRVAAVGEDVTRWTVDDRVGVGWHGGHCGQCRHCRHGDVLQCAEAEVTGMHRDGGYAEYAVAAGEALVPVPETLDSVDAAPLLCAGLTTFNALRNADAAPGDLVAVVGVGGLGHLGIQYARQCGFEVAAVSRTEEKREAALSLGADHFLASEHVDVAKALRELGGANVVLSTAPTAEAASSLVDALDVDGRVVVLGAPEEPIPVAAGSLIGARGGVTGWASGSPQDAAETLSFSSLRDVVPAVETFGLDEAERAYQRMLSSDVRFRAVLVV